MSVIEYRRFELVCDSPLIHSDHDAAYFNGEAERDTRTIPRAGVRHHAAKAGWTHVRSPLGRKYDRDYCPEHKP